VRYTIDDTGILHDETGSPVALPTIEDQAVHVPHLAPHVIRYPLPRGDIIGVKVIYSSHCWTEAYDNGVHSPALMKIMDGTRPRVFNSVRFGESKYLEGLLQALPQHKMYLTPSERNYGVYSATEIINGSAYTAFFTLVKDRGKLAKIRHSLVMRVESAYHHPQPYKGMKVSLAVAIDKALKREKLKYR
jgi:hypothetical protein